ncbi:MAG: bifunctional nicotinamide-nucleotide adenylyltransferase/Nudix hydroxylase, partial [Chitinivorax sp.]
SDDADKAKWVPLFEFSRMEDQLFEDHFYIVNWFLGQV